MSQFNKLQIVYSHYQSLTLLYRTGQIHLLFLLARYAYSHPLTLLTILFCFSKQEVAKWQHIFLVIYFTRAKQTCQIHLKRSFTITKENKLPEFSISAATSCLRHSSNGRFPHSWPWTKGHCGKSSAWTISGWSLSSQEPAKQLKRKQNLITFPTPMDRANLEMKDLKITHLCIDGCLSSIESWLLMK
jgi:hypothetical protein